MQTTMLDLLAAGELLIVPSDLAARRLRSSFDHVQQENGRRVWQPAPVLSWTQWLHSLWSDCIVAGTEDRLLLNAQQEHRLWQSVIAGAAQAQPEGTLSSSSSLAQLAAPAWRLAVAYGALRHLRSSATTHDARTFAVWAEQFSRTCRREGYVSQAELESVIAEHIRHGDITLPPRLHFSGFLNWTPAQHDLLQVLDASGVSVDHIPAEAPIRPERQLLCTESEDDEFRAVAHWVRHFLEKENSADAKVAVLVPDLDAQQNALESVFREVLAPELNWLTADASAEPYEFVSGKPLASWPLIAVALDLARWTAGPLPLQTVSALLLSPYLCRLEHLEGSAQFDACALRQAKLLRPEISLAWLVRLAERFASGAAALHWLQPLQIFLDGAADLQSVRSFAEWSEFIRRMLRASGWPGGPTNREELELARAWDHALDTVATLDFSGTRVPFAEALQALEHIVSTTAFSSASGEAAVQIMRPGDIAGMAFDAAIFVRATDDNWPLREQANPLIDWKLQASHAMPGADAAATAERNRSLLSVINNSAQDIVWSYAANNGEGKQRLSAEIERLELGAPETPELLADSFASEQVVLETLVDDSPLPQLPSATHVHGGASVLQHQAACGFRAFAEVRLRALSPEERQAGFDARELGDLLHRALHVFWSDVKTQSALRAMSEQERKQRFEECIDASFHRSLRVETLWDQAYVALQKQRLCSLLLQWMEHELKRGPFEVLSTESLQTLTVGPLDLNVRVDRLDKLPDVSEDAVLLVDYKTGYSAHPTGWLGERPDEPQLPLYALLPEAGSLAGLAFAKVRTGDSMEWLGYASDAGILPGRNTARDLPVLIEEWRTNLTALAEDFAAGDAGVRPKEYPVTCAHCGQRMLCRLDAATLLAAGEGNEAGQEDASLG